MVVGLIACWFVQDFNWWKWLSFFIRPAFGSISLFCLFAQIFRKVVPVVWWVDDPWGILFVGIVLPLHLVAILTAVLAIGASLIVVLGHYIGSIWLCINTVLLGWTVYVYFITVWMLDFFENIFRVALLPFFLFICLLDLTFLIRFISLRPPFLMTQPTKPTNRLSDIRTLLKNLTRIDIFCLIQISLRGFILVAIRVLWTLTINWFVVELLMVAEWLYFTVGWLLCELGIFENVFFFWFLVVLVSVDAGLFGYVDHFLVLVPSFFFYLVLSKLCSNHQNENLFDYEG